MTATDYLMIGGGWTVYFVFHSALASSRSKKWVSRHSGFLNKWYRLMYTLISSIGFVIMIYLMATTSSVSLFEPTGPLRYVALVITSWGVILIVVSFRHLSTAAFLGIKSEKEDGLIRKGLHAHIRHPIYAGTILVIVGMFLYIPTEVVLLTATIIFLYLPFGIHFEEQKLKQTFGEAYTRYRREVAALIPRLW